MSDSRFSNILATLIEFLTPFTSENEALRRWSNAAGSPNGQLEEDLNTLLHGLSLPTFLREFGDRISPVDRELIGRMVGSLERFVSATASEGIALDFFQTDSWLELQASVVSALPILRRLEARNDYQSRGSDYDPERRRRARVGQRTPSAVTNQADKSITTDFDHSAFGAMLRATNTDKAIAADRGSINASKAVRKPHSEEFMLMVSRRTGLIILILALSACQRNILLKKASAVQASNGTVVLTIYKKQPSDNFSYGGYIRVFQCSDSNVVRFLPVEGVFPLYVRTSLISSDAEWFLQHANKGLMCLSLYDESRIGMKISSNDVPLAFSRK